MVLPLEIHWFIVYYKVFLMLGQQPALQLVCSGRSDEYHHPEETCITSSNQMHMFWHNVEVQICSSGQLLAESRATGTVNTADKSFYDMRLKNSALAQILVWLLWLSVKADVYICVCQARLVSLVNYTQKCIIFT